MIPGTADSVAAVAFTDLDKVLYRETGSTKVFAPQQALVRPGDPWAPMLSLRQT